jgi:hypothetical protein
VDQSDLDETWIGKPLWWIAMRYTISSGANRRLIVSLLATE